MSTSDLHILYLTRWYPHPDDPQLGIFIRKHAKAASKYCRVSVLNVRADENVAEKFHMIKNEEENFSETIIHFKPASNRISNYIRFIKAHYLGFDSIIKSYSKPQLLQMNVMYGLCMVTLILHYKYYDIPFIVEEHWHGFVDNKFRNKNFHFKSLFRLTARKAKAIITVSEFLKKGMIANGLKSEYFVVPNVVESATTHKSKASDKIRMLTVADLDDSIKNISAVISVFSELIAGGLTAVEYHIIGGGKDEKKLRQLAAEKGLTNTIIFHGLQPNDFVLEFLNTIDFVIINSRYETFSVIAAEALLAGKPLVCTRCGGVDDFVDGDCGYMISSGDNDELKNALTSMIDNYSQFDTEKLKQKINNRFSSATVGKQLFDIYKMIIGNN